MRLTSNFEAIEYKKPYQKMKEKKFFPDAPECAQTRTRPAALSPAFVFRVSRFGLRVLCFVFRVSCLGTKVQGQDLFEFRVYAG
jgi:hypothetical protein